MDKNYYVQLFHHSPNPAVMIKVDLPNFILEDANQAFFEATGVGRDHIVGKNLGEAFPDTEDPNNNGPANLVNSLQTVVQNKQVDKMPVVKYDIVHPDTGQKDEKYWEVVNVPLFDDNNEVTKILHSVKDVTQEVLEAFGKSTGSASAMVLEELDLRFKNIFDFSSIGIAMLDLEGNWLEVNPQVLDILGYSRWELLGKDFKTMTHVEDQDQCSQALQQLLAGEVDSYKAEKRFYHKSGKQVWVYVSLALIRQSDPSLNHFIIHLIDITEKKEIEIALEDSEQRFQSLFKHNPDAVFSFDLEGRFVNANEATYRLAEADPDQLIGAYFLPLIPFEHKRLAYENFLKASEGSSLTYNCNFISHKGTERVLNVTNMPIYAHGEIVGVYGLAKDVTEKVLAEEALTKSKNQFEQLVSTIDGIVWESNENLHLSFISPQTEKILGYTSEQWYQNQNFWMENTHMEDRQLFWKEFLQGMENGGNFSFEFRMVHADGSVVWVRNVVTVIKKPGRATIIRGILTDISETKKAEQDLEQNRAKLSKIMKRSLDIICTIDEDGHFQDVSAASKGVWGYEPKELIGKPFIDLVYEEDRDTTNQVANEIKEGKDVTSFENRYVHKEGHLVPISWSTHFDPREKLFFAVAHDNTIRKEAEIQLQMSERRFKNLVQNGADIVGIVDTNANFVYISANVKDVVGYSPEELKSKKGLALVHPDDVEIVQKALQEITQTKRLVIPAHRFSHKNGGYIWVDTVATNHLDDPAINGIVINSRDITDKVKANEELRNSEERHKLLFNYNPIPQWVFCPNTQAFLDVNQTAIDTYGYSKEEFLSMTIQDIRPKKALTKLQKSLSQYTPEKGPHNFGVHTHRKKDGELIKVEVTGYQFDYLGRQGVMIAAIDVTEREKALASLKDYRNKLQTAQEIANMGYWQIDLKDNSLYWTEALYKIWEVEPKEVADVGWFYTTIHPDDLHLVKEAFVRGVETGEELDFEYRIQISDTKCKWIHEMGQLVTDKEGNKLFMEGTVQDITERKAAEEALNQSNQRYELVTQATSDAIWDWDVTTGRVVYGESFYKTFGFDSLSLKEDRSDWEEKIHPNDQSRVNDSMLQFMQGGENNWEEEYRYRKANGEYATVLDKAIAIRDENGNPVRIVGALQDISLEHHLENENQLRLSLRSIFSSDANPVEAIKASLSELLAYTELTYGEVWLVSLNNSKNLTLAAYQGQYQVAPSQFQMEIEQHEGLPGKVFQANCISVLTELAENPHFKRSNFVRQNQYESAIAYPIHFKDEVLGVLIFFTDNPQLDLEKSNKINPIILDQLSSDYARKQTENELNSLFNLSRDLLFISGYDNLVKKVNQAATDVLGYAEEEIKNTNFSDFVHPKDKDKTQKAFENLKKGGPLSYFENRLIAKSGQAIWMSWTASSVMEENRIFAIARDISERKNYEQELENSRKAVADTLESIQDAFYALDESFTITYWNKEAERVLFKSREEVLGKNLWEAFPDAVDLQFYPQYHKAMEEKTHLVFEEYFPPVEAWFELSVYPAQNGISVYFRNITEKKRHYEELKSSRQKVNTILESIQEAFFSVDHEWNITYWNKEAEKVLMSRREDVLGKNLWEAFPEAKSLGFFTKYHEVRDKKKKVNFLEYFPPLEKWFEVTAYPAENGITVYFTDATARKQLEDEIGTDRK